MLESGVPTLILIPNNSDTFKTKTWLKVGRNWIVKMVAQTMVGRVTRIAHSITKNVLQLLYIIAHEIMVSNSVSEYTHGPWNNYKLSSGMVKWPD